MVGSYEGISGAIYTIYPVDLDEWYKKALLKSRLEIEQWMGDIVKHERDYAREEWRRPGIVRVLNSIFGSSNRDFDAELNELLNRDVDKRYENIVNTYYRLKNLEDGYRNELIKLHKEIKLWQFDIENYEYNFIKNNNRFGIIKLLKDNSKFDVDGGNNLLQKEIDLDKRHAEIENTYNLIKERQLKYGPNTVTLKYVKTLIFKILIVIWYQIQI